MEWLRQVVPHRSALKEIRLHVRISAELQHCLFTATTKEKQVLSSCILISLQPDCVASGRRIKKKVRYSHHHRRHHNHRHHQHYIYENGIKTNENQIYETG